MLRYHTQERRNYPHAPTTTTTTTITAHPRPLTRDHPFQLYPNTLPFSCNPRSSSRPSLSLHRHRIIASRFSPGSFKQPLVPQYQWFPTSGIIPDLQLLNHHHSDSIVSRLIYSLLTRNPHNLHLLLLILQILPTSPVPLAKSIPRSPPSSLRKCLIRAPLSRPCRLQQML